MISNKMDDFLYKHFCTFDVPLKLVGGSIIDMQLGNYNSIKDFDIYTDKKTVDYICKNLLHTVYTVSEGRTKVKFPFSDIPFDFIHNENYNFDSIDFTICAQEITVNKGRIIKYRVAPNTKNDLRNKVLRITDEKNIKSSIFQRLNKYGLKGFKLDETSIEVLKNAFNYSTKISYYY